MSQKKHCARYVNEELLAYPSTRTCSTTTLSIHSSCKTLQKMLLEVFSRNFCRNISIKTFWKHTSPLLWSPGELFIARIKIFYLAHGISNSVNSGKSFRPYKRREITSACESAPVRALCGMGSSGMPVYFIIASRSSAER